MLTLLRRTLALVLILVGCWLPFAIGLATAEALDPIFQLGEEFPFDEDTPILEIFYLQTRRSDGIFLRCGDRTMLVDGGARRDYTPLEKFLMAEVGELHIGTVLNTHEDNDHMDAEIEFFKRGGTASEFLSPSPPNPKTRRYDELLPMLKKLDIPYVQVAHGEFWQLGGDADGKEDGAHRLSSLADWQDGTALLRAYCSRINVWDINRSSLVLHVTFGDRTAILMADATGKTQRDFLVLDDIVLKADVLKAAHHGISPTVAPFLDAVDPKLGIITNTRKNGKPQREQFERREIPALYTDEGTVYMATDGKIWYIRQDVE